MAVFEKISSSDHEQIIYINDSSCNLKAIIAIHDTTLGPALGGTRMWPYASEQEALTDVLRLSEGMTYKAAVSGLNLGGGKAVIIGDPKKDKSEALFRSYGRFVESLNGRYITAEDVNVTVDDIDSIFIESNNVVGVNKIHGGSGNPAPYTALGVFRGMEASVTKVFGDRSVKGKTIAIQGVGAVGFELSKLLKNGGANIVYTDINKDNISRMEEFIPEAQFVNPDEIFDVACDVHSPCALGASINDETIDRIKSKIICGAANNQLAEDRHGVELKNRNILYAPDYLINAGGLMNVSIEFEGWSDAKSRRMIDKIYDTTLDIFKISEDENIAVYKATDRLAERRIEAIKNIKTSYMGRVSTHRFPGRKRHSMN